MNLLIGIIIIVNRGTYMSFEAICQGFESIKGKLRVYYEFFNILGQISMRILDTFIIEKNSSA